MSLPALRRNYYKGETQGAYPLHSKINNKYKFNKLGGQKCQKKTKMKKK